MESKYLEIEREVGRRRRRLNTLKGLRLGLTWAMGLTVAYLICVYIGLLGMIQPWWLLILFNILGAWAGARWGRSRPIALQADLYRVDRVFHLGEKLSTIYELRTRSGSADFLRALYRRLEGLHLDPAKALPFPKREQHTWMGLGSLLLLSMIFLGLWFLGVAPLRLGGLFDSVSFGEYSALPTSPLQNSSDPNRSTAASQDRNASPQGTPPEARSSLDRSSATCQREQDSYLSSEGDQGDNPDWCGGLAEGEPPTPSSLDSDSESPASRGQALSQLLSKFLKLAEEGELDRDRLRDELEGLADQAPEGPVKQALRQAATASDLEEMQRRLKEALSQAQAAEGSNDRQATDEPREESNPRSDGSTEGEQRSVQPDETQRDERSSAEDGAAQSSSQGDRAEAKETEGEGADAQGQGETSQPGGDAPPTESSGDSSQTDQGGDPSQGSEGAPIGEQDFHISNSERAPNQGDGGDARTGGSDPGQQAGQDLHSSDRQAESPAFQRDLFIHGGALPPDVKLLERLLTHGLPVDLAGEQPDGTPILRLNLERVEALLDLRDLPSELRELVRSYFLAIAGDR